MALLTGPSLSSADFGLSINESNSQANTMEVGTPGYCGAALFRPLAPDLQLISNKLHNHVSIARDQGTLGSFSGCSSASGCFVRVKGAVVKTIAPYGATTRVRHAAACGCMCMTH